MGSLQPKFASVGEAGTCSILRLLIAVPRTDGGVAKACRASQRRGWLGISGVWCFPLRLCVLACIGVSTVCSSVLSRLLSTVPAAWCSTPRLQVVRFRDVMRCDRCCPSRISPNVRDGGGALSGWQEVPPIGQPRPGLLFSPPIR